jgi:hypothetical protein
VGWQYIIVKRVEGVVNGKQHNILVENKSFHTPDAIHNDTMQSTAVRLADKSHDRHNIQKTVPIPHMHARTRTHILLKYVFYSYNQKYDSNNQ